LAGRLLPNWNRPEKKRQGALEMYFDPRKKKGIRLWLGHHRKCNVNKKGWVVLQTKKEKRG